MTCGPLVPMPSTNRPPESACIESADIASIAGVRAPSCTMPVANRMVDVRAGKERERREGVAGPELGHPHRVDAELLGLSDELDACSPYGVATTPTRSVTTPAPRGA